MSEREEAAPAMSMISAACRLGMVAVAVAVAIPGCDRQSDIPSTATTQPAMAISERKSVEFADTGGSYPQGIAIDPAGTVYLATLDGPIRIVPGTDNWPATITVPGFTADVAFDTAGALYFTARENSSDKQDQVLKVEPGGTVPTVLPITGLNWVQGLTVDSAQNVYVVDKDNNRVLHLPPGASGPVDLPVDGLTSPSGVAVDAAGNIYITDDDRVVKLDAGTHRQSVLPFDGLYGPWGVTIDSTGAVYVADSDNNRVLKLPAGSDQQAELPFSGLNFPTGVAVDSGSNVYVVNRNDGRILKLPAS